MNNDGKNGRHEIKAGEIVYRAINGLLYVTVAFVVVGIYLKKTVPAVFYISLAWAALYIIALVLFLRYVMKLHKQLMQKANETSDVPAPSNPLLIKLLDAYKSDGLESLIKIFKESNWRVHYIEKIKNELYIDIARGYNEVFIMLNETNITINFDEEGDDITSVEPMEKEKYPTAEDLFLHLSEKIEQHYKPTSTDDKN